MGAFLPAALNPPKRTFPRDRFIPLHIIFVNIIPLAPTKAPDTINKLFKITKPAAHAANPEQLFNKEITTGISAAPMGRTNITPNIKEKAKIK